MDGYLWSVMLANQVQEDRDARLFLSEDLAIEGDIGNVRKQVAALVRTVHDLQVTVAVLGRRLAATGTLDAQALRDEVARELAADAAQPATTVCTRCNRTVLERATTITPAGVMCDMCATMP